LVSGFMGGAVLADGGHDTPLPPKNDWTFAGPFGTFDKTQLQRGFKVYREVCSSCHSMGLVSFRNLAQPGGPGFTEGQVKALAASYKVKDGPNDAGEMFERDGRAADRWPSPFPNKQAAAAANGGAIPPDFSVIAKARSYSRGFPLFLVDMFTLYQEHGVDYITALLQGYSDDTHGVEVPAGKYYNTFYPGNVIAMPKPLNDGQVEYPKGADGRPQAPETVAQYSKDVSAFLMWAAEPKLEQRKETGFRVILFLIVLAGLFYFTKKKIWSRVEGHH
jgi:ubiquinol-cytochrome c reductase cytochrome c1 subunit